VNEQLEGVNNCYRLYSKTGGTSVVKGIRRAPSIMDTEALPTCCQFCLNWQIQLKDMGITAAPTITETLPKCSQMADSVKVFEK